MDLTSMILAQPGAVPQQQMTPQQRLAMALMTQQQPATNAQGAYSPLQGLAQIGNKAIALRMMQQAPPVATIPGGGQ